MAKPKPVRVASDDYTVKTDGGEYTPHEGEWVELYPHRSIGELQALENYTKIAVEFDTAKGEPDETMRTIAIVNSRTADLLRYLAKRIVAWSWTDLRGDPLPQPNGTPDALSVLSNEELTWLISAGQGETPSAAKNA